MNHRRRRLVRSALVAGVGLAGCSGPASVERSPTATDRTTAAATETPTGDARVTIGLETIADGFTAPIDFVDPGGGVRYVADQVGVIHAMTADGVAETPFLDLRGRLVELGGYEERGLLGLALHPNYPDTDRVFVRYSAPPREGTPDRYDHTFVLAEFATESPRRADPDSERTLLEIPEPQGNHNAGAIAFGPNGNLYVAVGDGGGANDVSPGHVDDWYRRNGGGNGQDRTENLLGNLLRIDVDVTDGDRAYGIPEDNPLVGQPGFDEQYAWGFRNPWRLSFAGDELFVADVGQNRFEEVNLVERGGNYGWNVREGRHCFDAAAPGEPMDRCPTETPAGEPLIDPIIEYSHGGGAVSGVAVVGGYLYRGSAIPRLTDRYVFGDWVADGRLFVADRPDDGGAWSTAVLPIRESDRSKLTNLLAFGADRAGELYVLTSDRRSLSGETGAIHRLVPN